MAVSAVIVFLLKPTPKYSLDTHADLVRDSRGLARPCSSLCTPPSRAPARPYSSLYTPPSRASARPYSSLCIPPSCTPCLGIDTFDFSSSLRDCVDLLHSYNMISTVTSACCCTLHRSRSWLSPLRPRSSEQGHLPRPQRRQCPRRRPVRLHAILHTNHPIIRNNKEFAYKAFTNKESMQNVPMIYCFIYMQSSV